MTTAVLDDRDQRRAQARAAALSILDEPRRVRRFEKVPGAALRSSERARAHARPKPAPSEQRRRPWLRRLVAGAIVLTQVALLVLALALPVFQVRGAQINGLHLLRTRDVLAAADVPHQSVFILDTQAVQRRLDALPWVQSSTVTTSLPASVHIAVTERAVALRIRRGGVDTLLAANGATMPVTATAVAAAVPAPPLLDGRAGSQQPLSPVLIQDLATISQHFPAVFGCQVAAYQWGVDDILSLWTGTGWKVVLGHLDTQDALAALPAQLAALAALRGSVDMVHPSFGYIDLEDPSAPAVGGAPGLPADVQAAVLAETAPTGAPGAAGVTPPNPLPAPTPKPTATPRATPSATPQPTPSAT
ncbi:MAG: FtsQ-type POTRA domain-containing protein [Candidatus Dormibacteraeota bacterium]|nr:FtsQ-type POTRA domain-containing protein [Candidatus Dormibacteraeota bacterium]